jgi:predicted nucleic acid-binding protein
MKVFADTFYYLAFLDPNDSYHDKALSLTLELEVTVVTTAWVLSELGSALSAPAHRPTFGRLVDELRDDADVILYEADRTLFDEGLRLYREREDKGWSLTDCISFVVMEREGITEALTGDRHFAQAGFKTLL